MIRFDLTECFVDDGLGGVVDVIGVVNDSRFDGIPIPSLLVEAAGFVADASGFETAGLQVVATPRGNV